MRRVWVVGAGKRVRETALPAFASLAESFEIAGVFGRSARTLDGGLVVRALATLSEDEFRDGDLVYVAVGKDAVPDVLQTLAGFDRSKLELLIDTPVLRFKHLRHAPLLEGWRRASVAEDTAYLPWYATATAALGPISSVQFERSAYAYHGHAQAKALLGGKRIVRARMWTESADEFYRTLWLDHDRREGTKVSRNDFTGEVDVIGPRDYSVGLVTLNGARASLADRWDPVVEHGHSLPWPADWPRLLLAPIVEDGLCVGFRAGDVETRLDPREAELTRGDAPGATITARMESMKRIGFRRLLQDVAADRGAYPIAHGLEDMAVDWFLERFRFYRANVLMNVRQPFARFLWSWIGRLR